MSMADNSLWSLNVQWLSTFNILYKQSLYRMKNSKQNLQLKGGGIKHLLLRRKDRLGLDILKQKISQGFFFLFFKGFEGMISD